MEDGGSPLFIDDDDGRLRPRPCIKFLISAVVLSLSDVFQFFRLLMISSPVFSATPSTLRKMGNANLPSVRSHPLPYCLPTKYGRSPPPWIGPLYKAVISVSVMVLLLLLSEMKC